MYSPAKVNLFLKVLRRRSDGFHDLHTLFMRVSLCDKLTFSKTSSDIKIHSNSKNLPLDATNLCYMAAILLKERYGVREGVKIFIQKRIPFEAGLGGGSSNAAATLLALNRLWKLHLPQKTLIRLGAEIGSDVAFFVLNTSFAEASGRGEILRKINLPKLKIWLVLIKPDFGISTKEAYKALPASCLTPKKADVKMLVHSIQKGDFEALQKLLINSLELSQNNRVRSISKLKKELLDCGASASLMSGSGSTVFGIFSSKSKAQKAASFLREKNKKWQVFVVSNF